MPIVQDPSGNPLEFPDDMSMDDIAKVMAAHFPPPDAVNAFGGPEPHFPAAAQSNPSFADPNTVVDPNDITKRIPRPNVESKPENILPTLANIAIGVRKGATFGAADYLDAAMNMLVPGKNFMDFKANLDEQRKIFAPLKMTDSNGAPIDDKSVQAGETMGLMTAPAKGIGMAADRILPIVGEGMAGLARRYGNYALQGGMFNSAYEAALGDPEKAKEGAATAGGMAGVGMVAPEGGGVMDAALSTAKNFGKGAAMGVIPPAVLESAGPVAKFVLSPILKRISPEEWAIAGIGKALDRSNLTPGMFAAKIDKLGDAGMPANVGGGVTDYARDIVQYPGRARNQAQSAFKAQAGGKFSTRGGAVGRVEDAIDNTLTDETAKASTDALVDLRTKSSAPLWQKMFETPQAVDSPILDVLANNPEIQRGMKIGQSTARNNANAAGQELDPAKFDINGKPTLEAWHSAKEGLDDILFSGGDNIVNPTTGKLTKYGNSINGMRKSVLEELKLAHPEYADALQSWAGPTQAARMIELGAKLAKGDARVTRDMIDGLTPNEMDFLRIGLADQAKYLVSKTRTGSNVTNSIFADQNQRRNIEMMFNGRGEFNQFRKALAAEEKMHSSKQTILGGSQTSEKLHGSKDMAGEMGAATIEGAKNGGATGAAAGLASRGWNYLKSEPEGVRDAAGRYLFSTDPQKKNELINLLSNQYENGKIYGNPGLNRAPSLNLLGLKTFGF